jgi:hypothetical protein
VGTSTREDVLKLLGKPIREDFANPEDDSDEVWYIYNNAGDLPGQFEAHINKKSGLLVALSLGMTGDVDKETVLKLFGDDYEMVRYDACPDSAESEAGPFYESSNGQAISYEYRSRGIAVDVNYKGMVQGIEYLQRPPGLSSREECPPYVEPPDSPDRQRDQNAAPRVVPADVSFRAASAAHGVDGDGCKFSSQGFLSSDGVGVSLQIKQCKSASHAESVLRQLERKATNVFESTPLTDNNGQRVGLRIVVALNGHEPLQRREAILWRKGDEIYIVTSESFEHALAFEKKWPLDQ